MKKTIALIIAMALLIGAAGTVPFIASAGGGEFPDEPIEGKLYPDTAISNTFPSYSERWFEFTSDKDAFYSFSSVCEGDLDVEVYTSDGRIIAADQYSGENQNFNVLAYAKDKEKLYLKVTSYCDSCPYIIDCDYSNVSSVEIIEAPAKTEYTVYIDHEVDINGLKLRITYTDGNTIEWYAEEGYGPFGYNDYEYIRPYFRDEGEPVGMLSSMQDGVILFFAGYRLEYDITVNEFPYYNAVIKSLPYRNNYVVGLDYDIDLTGMEITLLRLDGGEETYSFDPYSDNYFPYMNCINYGTDITEEGYTVIDFKPGENSVFIDIFWFERFFTRNAVENTYDHIEIVKYPNKTAYTEGDFDDPSVTGAVMRVYYKNGSYKDISLYDNVNKYDGHYMYVLFDNYPIALGGNTATVHWADMEATFSVSGFISPVQSISVITTPNRTDYYMDLYGSPMIDLEGARIMVTCADGTYYFPEDEETLIKYNFNCYFDDALHPGTNTVVVSCGKQKAYFTVQVYERTVERVLISKYPDRTEYYDGELMYDFDPSGLELYLIHTNGSTSIWSYDDFMGRYNGNPVKFYGTDFHQLFTEFTFEIGGINCTIPIRVYPFDVSELSVKTKPGKDGMGFVGQGVRGDGVTTFTFDGPLFQKETAEEYYTGEMRIKKWIYMPYSCESFPTGVQLYIFGKTLWVPFADGDDAKKGDMDGDGNITVADALAALRIAAKLVAETPEALATGDVDNDGSITVADALAILRVAAKLTDHF